MKLSKYEQKVARAIMCAILPPTESRIAPIADLDLEGFARYATEDIPLKPALGFRAVIWITLFAPIFVLKKFKTFMGIDEDERDRVVDALIYSSIYEVRALFLFFKAYTSLFFFTSRRVRAQVTEDHLTISGERLVREVRRAS